MANRRKNQENKAASTANRPDRNAHATGSAVSKIPSAPATLGDYGKVEWITLGKVLIKQKILTEGDLRSLETLCVALDLERKLREKLDSEGLFRRDDKGREFANPAMRLLTTTQTQIMRMMAEFGLTPRGRQSIDPLKTADTGNEFAGLDD